MNNNGDYLENLHHNNRRGPGGYTECELSNLGVLIHIQSKYGKEGGQGYGLLLRPCKVISTTVKRRVGNSAFAHLFF